MKKIKAQSKIVTSRKENRSGHLTSKSKETFSGKMKNLLEKIIIGRNHQEKQNESSSFCSPENSNFNATIKISECTAQDDK